mmetsp:Transcript_12175/g.37490  ORF Transcript_12175/g.37490 Transcript_12175/m.37490 type:complete len:319 (-) Transcript_12175:339-1295(-)
MTSAVSIRDISWTGHKFRRPATDRVGAYTTYPTESSPRRPARPAICQNSSTRSQRCPCLEPVSSGLSSCVNVADRAGMFTPTASVSVAKTKRTNFCWKQSSTNSRRMGNMPEWWYATPRSKRRLMSRYASSSPSSGMYRSKYLRCISLRRRSASLARFLRTDSSASHASNSSGSASSGGRGGPCAPNNKFNDLHACAPWQQSFRDMQKTMPGSVSAASSALASFVHSCAKFNGLGGLLPPPPPPRPANFGALPLPAPPANASARARCSASRSPRAAAAFAAFSGSLALRFSSAFNENNFWNCSASKTPPFRPAPSCVP